MFCPLLSATEMECWLRLLRSEAGVAGFTHTPGMERCTTDARPRSRTGVALAHPYAGGRWPRLDEPRARRRWLCLRESKVWNTAVVHPHQGWNTGCACSNRRKGAPASPTCTPGWALPSPTHTPQRSTRWLHQRARVVCHSSWSVAIDGTPMRVARSLWRYVLAWNAAAIARRSAGRS